MDKLGNIIILSERSHTPKGTSLHEVSRRGSSTETGADKGLPGGGGRKDGGMMA